MPLFSFLGTGIGKLVSDIMVMNKDLEKIGTEEKRLDEVAMTNTGDIKGNNVTTSSPPNILAPLMKVNHRLGLD